MSMSVDMRQAMLTLSVRIEMSSVEEGWPRDIGAHLILIMKTGPDGVEREGWECSICGALWSSMIAGAGHTKAHRQKPCFRSE